ncbi:hypothetical protein GCM10009105_32090 [Dokdonella soli]|uniref:Uncharacterized protein n=1 Tax=Dokdonella soli TaxID=529810 RepID=A0ABN1IV35_9GAMM
MNAGDDIRNAIADARSQLSAADSHVRQMADLLCGRLKHVNHHTLIKLKRELRDFDAHKKEWKQ